MTHISYAVGEYEPDASSVEVTYTNSDTGYTYVRSVNIPRTEEGIIDEEGFEEILEGQLLGVLNKLAVGVITFTDPNASDEVDEPDADSTPASVETEV
tara:strand:- start:791 stop:1084 length:294 start_codon:yes stop_codon:yes gene_type:complete